MTEQNVNANVTEIKGLGTEATAAAAASLMEGLSTADKEDVAESAGLVLDKPGRVVTNIIWITVIPVISLLILGSAFYVMTFERDGLDSDTLITIFTTSFAFLGGLFAQSPVSSPTRRR